MENEILKAIEGNYKNKSNKELSKILMTLHNDFYKIKNHMLEMVSVLTEIGEVYDKVYLETQSRLKFENKKIEDAS